MNSEMMNAATKEARSGCTLEHSKSPFAEQTKARNSV